MAVDPITLTVLQKRLVSITNEMSNVLRRTAYSPNIKERADFSCAIFDKNGKLLAQAAAIPVHLGSMQFVAEPIIEMFSDWSDGDAIVTNSPRAEYGGTHLPDITLLSPVFNTDGDLQFVVANRAHHADVGGMTPGSLPSDSTEIFQEGLIIPPIKIFEGGTENKGVMRFILENVRTPVERRGDLKAQYSSLTLGKNRLEELFTKFTVEEIEILLKALLSRSKEGTERRLAEYPDGEGFFEDYLDSDGYSDDPVKISCNVVIKDGTIDIDFTGSAPQQQGNCNSPLSVTTAACYYVVRLLTGTDVPTNAGCFEPVSIQAPPKTVVNPTRNAATSSANTETSSRIVDTVLGALATFLPLPSASQGTMNNLLIGGEHQGTNWSIYETIGGGTGGGPDGPGESAIQSHMTNTENTPIEALELSYPLRVREYAIRRGSGGSGEHPGGDGIIREIELLDKATITLQTERRSFAPWGQGKGSPAKKGENIVIFSDENYYKSKYKNIQTNIILGKNSKVGSVPGKTTLPHMDPGTRIRLLTPGGGGWS